MLELHKQEGTEYLHNFLPCMGSGWVRKIISIYVTLGPWPSLSSQVRLTMLADSQSQLLSSWYYLLTYMRVFDFWFN